MNDDGRRECMKLRAMVDNFMDSDEELPMYLCLRVMIDFYDDGTDSLREDLQHLGHLLDGGHLDWARQGDGFALKVQVKDFAERVASGVPIPGPLQEFASEILSRSMGGESPCAVFGVKTGKGRGRPAKQSRPSEILSDVWAACWVHFLHHEGGIELSKAYEMVSEGRLIRQSGGQGRASAVGADAIKKIYAKYFKPSRNTRK